MSVEILGGHVKLPIRSLLNRRSAFAFVALLVAGILTAHGALSQAPTRKAINLPDKPAQLPFSDAIVAGNTVYLAGRLGLDKDGKVPADINDEIKNLLDSFKPVMAQAGITWDDVAYVTVYCTDLTLFDKFNPIYKTYFTKDLPVRAFIGAGSLLRGAHFELQAIAVKR
jgi:2-iminobutanoate/2-iminopropanoate deaminase